MNTAGSAEGRLSHTLGLSLSLFALWLLLSGHYTGLLISLGAISVFFVVRIARRMAVVDSESVPLELNWRAPVYWLWLYGEILKSNWQVLKRICQPAKPIKPAAAWLSTSQHSDLARVIYANSITLTPGTVTLNVEGERILVHALEESTLADLKAGSMDQRVTRLEQQPAVELMDSGSKST